MRRRIYKPKSPIISKEKTAYRTFCLDFKDSEKNNNLMVTDTIQGLQLIKEQPGSVEFKTKYQGFERIYHTKTSSAENVYSISYANLIPFLGSEFPSVGDWSIVCFSNSVGTNAARSGLLSVWNQGYITGYQGYKNLDWYGGMLAGMNKIKYSGYTNQSDIGLYAMTWNLEERYTARTAESTGFTNMEIFSEKFQVPTFTSTGTLVFGRSQESNYYFAAGGLCAGIAIYKGRLTNEMIRQIYDSKQFIDFLI